jgi:hypothetical protein
LTTLVNLVCAVIVLCGFYCIVSLVKQESVQKAEKLDSTTCQLSEEEIFIQRVFEIDIDENNQNYLDESSEEIANCLCQSEYEKYGFSLMKRDYLKMESFGFEDTET